PARAGFPTTESPCRAMKSTDPASSIRRAFTLVEFLAVIALVGVLSAVVRAAVVEVRRDARRAECASNLRKIYAAIMLYAADNKGRLVAAHASDPGNEVVWSDSWQRDRWESPLTAYVGDKTVWGRLVVCPENRTDEPV